MSINEIHKNDSVSLEPIDLLNHILQTKTYKDIATRLNLALGTVKRWSELDSVQISYRFALMEIANIPIVYSQFSFKEKDQFFTPSTTAKYCISQVEKILLQYEKQNVLCNTKYMFVEPSAGNGKFLELLPLNRRIGVDIEPHHSEVRNGNYLSWSPLVMDEPFTPESDSSPEPRKYIVVGNPPFGLRGQLALQFINHSSTFADYVCFILPQLFESDGKGVPRKRVVGMNLIHSEKLQTDFEDPSGNPIPVECIFQIWSKHFHNSTYDIRKPDISQIKVYSLSDGGTPSTTRNKKMFHACDMYLPSTCFGKENMKRYDSFDTLPRRKGYGIVFLEHPNKEKNMDTLKNTDWSKVAFLSTNSAYNLRTSQIINVLGESNSQCVG